MYTIVLDVNGGEYEYVLIRCQNRALAELIYELMIEAGDANNDCLAIKEE
jgi:hypothetical protein